MTRNKTVNYELSQFEGTDKPSWEADYNADMLSIDTNLKAVSDVADGASGSISTLADRVTTAEGNITTNANDIDALEARADALEAGETAADGRLDALEVEQIVQNTAIESNTRLGYNLARPYDSASTYKSGEFSLFQNTLYECMTDINTGEAFDPSKWLAVKATDFNAPIMIDGASEIYSSYDDTNFRHYHPIVISVGHIAHFSYVTLQVANDTGISKNTLYTLGTLKLPYRPIHTIDIPLTATIDSNLTSITAVGIAEISANGTVYMSFDTDLPKNSIIAFNACYACNFSFT